MEQIKNDQLTLEISSLGAELQSIKDANGNEYEERNGKEHRISSNPICSADTHLHCRSSNWD